MTPPAGPGCDDWEAFWDAEDGDSSTRRIALAIAAGAVIVLTAVTLWAGCASTRRPPVETKFPSPADIIVRPPPPR